MFRCVLCRSTETDEVMFGEALDHEIQVHTFCLYLTPNLCQAGNENEGLLGFLIGDIKKEARRISKLNCCYCSKSFANIGCCNVKCRRTFHFKCGIKCGAENQFVGTYNSYCDLHVRKKSGIKAPNREEKCCVCYEVLRESGQRFSAVNMLQAPCCKNGWFHKLCLQEFAKNAGYFFKCPLCNDKQIFCEKLPYKGIFLYKRDAAWELEPNAFAEQLERPSACAADKCKYGRRKTTSKNPLLLCMGCGSVAMHKRCLPIGLICNNFYCNDCKCINQDSNGENLRLAPTNESDTDDDESDVDVCNDSDETELPAESKDAIIKVPANDEITLPGTGMRRLHRIYDDDDGNCDADGHKDNNEDDEEEFAHCLSKEWTLRRKNTKNKIFDEVEDIELESQDQQQNDEERKTNVVNCKESSNDEVQNSYNTKSEALNEDSDSEQKSTVKISQIEKSPKQKNDDNGSGFQECKNDYNEEQNLCKTKSIKNAGKSISFDETPMNIQTSNTDDDDVKIPKSSTLSKKLKIFDESCTSDDSNCSTNKIYNDTGLISAAGPVESGIKSVKSITKEDNASNSISMNISCSSNSTRRNSKHLAAETISSFSTESHSGEITPKTASHQTTLDSCESLPVQNEQENSMAKICDIQRSEIKTICYQSQISNESSEGYETNVTSGSIDQSEIQQYHSEENIKNDAQMRDIATSSENSTETQFESFASGCSKSSTSTKSSYKSIDCSMLENEIATSMDCNASIKGNRLKVVLKRVRNLSANSSDETPCKHIRLLPPKKKESYSKHKRLASESRIQRNFRIENAKCPMRSRHGNIIPYLTPNFKRSDGHLKRDSPNVF